MTGTPGDDVAALTAQLRAIREERQRLEASNSRRANIEGAIAVAERDLQARSSPALRIVQGRAEHLKKRLEDARSSADWIVMCLHRLTTSISSGEVANPAFVSEDDDESEVGDFAAIPAVRRMRTMIDEHVGLRRRTDSIAGNDTAGAS